MHATSLLNDSRFPHEPTNDGEKNDANAERNRIMGIPDKNCDDGKVWRMKLWLKFVHWFKFLSQTNLATDFDPHSYDHSIFYTCLESTYKPNYDVDPIKTSYDVNKFYTPVHRCMNETLTYDPRLPTLGEKNKAARIFQFVEVHFRWFYASEN